MSNLVASIDEKGKLPTQSLIILVQEFSKLSGPGRVEPTHERDEGIRGRVAASLEPRVGEGASRAAGSSFDVTPADLKHCLLEEAAAADHTHGIRERLWKAGLLTRTRANVRAGVPAMSSLSLPICPRGSRLASRAPRPYDRQPRGHPLPAAGAWGAGIGRSPMTRAPEWSPGRRSSADGRVYAPTTAAWTRRLVNDRGRATFWLARSMGWCRRRGR